MSLCNAARFFAVYTTLVLSVLGSPLPGPVGREHGVAAPEVIHDLEPQGSLTVEIKNDPKIPHDISNLKFNNVKDDANSIPIDSELAKKNANKFTHQTITPIDKTTIPTSIVKERGSEQRETTKDVNQMNMTREVSQQTEGISNTVSKNNNTSIPINNNTFTVKNLVNLSTSLVEAEPTMTVLESQTRPKNSKSMQLENTSYPAESVTMGTKSMESHRPLEPMESSPTTSTIGVTVPTRRKYTVIERKRVITGNNESMNASASSSNEGNTVSTITEEITTIKETTEILVKSESAQGRISLQDAITSDIPSLEKLKTDLLSSPNYTTKSNTETTTGSISTQEIINKTDMTTPVMTTFSFSSSSESPNTVSSKRAGYLDLTAKYSSTENLSGLKLNETESLQGPFDAETPDTQDETADDKHDKRKESQSQLSEDAIKEELLKEEMLNNNEENAMRQRIEGPTTTALPATDGANATQPADLVEQPPLAGADELSVKPISSDKGKNTILYPVNPNYKPLKKIEVQPAKPFVRDPDDNSWRNESLSSLGIVFKPKNSSKPFTQVLKNKTETEWNNVSEKDRKIDVPDLRVRLEQITQKRKSKKKKIDSLGNVYYTDYEETSSSSEENPITPQAEDPSTTFTTFTTDVTPTTDVTNITIVTPVQTITTPSSPLDMGVLTVLTTAPTPTENIKSTQRLPNKMTTLKPPKMFNIFDYYDSNEDDDIADYLNMAKIDLKKYTVPLHTTFTPYTSPPLPVLYTNPMTQYTQERKGTVQYFPPTKRPRKNKQVMLRNKLNSLTEAPKTVLSYKLTTTPFDEGLFYTHSPETTAAKEDLMQPKDFGRELYLTTPPLTTLTTPDDAYGEIGANGYRPNYVLKHYKDFVNVAANAGSEPPRGVTLTDLMKTKDKEEEYDYDAQFRRDVLARFVANFNADAKDFRSGFPIVYNNSVVHGDTNYGDKEVALSRAYFRRPYSNQGEYRPLAGADPCENATVELSPAYELQYFVPGQEERMPVEPPTQPPYRL